LSASTKIWLLSLVPAVAWNKPQQKPQVDAVVTDAKGRHVTDLRAEGFEMLEDGRPQQVVNFSYISARL
jgi:hypothetical protein